MKARERLTAGMAPEAKVRFLGGGQTFPSREDSDKEKAMDQQGNAEATAKATEPNKATTEEQRTHYIVLCRSNGEVLDTYDIGGEGNWNLDKSMARSTLMSVIADEVAKETK